MPKMTRQPGVTDLLGEPNGFQSRERTGGLDHSFSGSTFMTHAFKCQLFITMLDYLCLYVQHNERGSAGQGGRRYDRQASGYGRQRDQKEHLADRDKQKDVGHSLHGKVEQDDGDSTWRHDGFFQLEEEAPLAKKRPPFQEMKMQDSAATVADPDSGSRKPDQPGPNSAIREERRNYHPRGSGNHRPFIRPDDRGFRRGFPDHRSEGHRNGYDSRGRFPGRGGMDRDRFSSPYGGRGNMYHQTSGDQEEKWKHDLYDQSNRSPPPKTEEEQIAKVEALLAL
ncbi:unnamed protein product [Urochloa decumbens]|uniref:Btz domain-containing protein n=1 Tax=Urochloa decumbens TaxID=240449 RepID=A0ABC8Y7D1_9POAL